ncbi:MAG: MiaB/RimO family radical SAM methylthiotransferase, partial [Eubacterium sp.]|nr:MiaB/RimO family radical SAM methylthiotransferase [Eubacterium sp.]
KYNIEKQRILAINEHKTGDTFSKCSISKFSDRVRAFVKIEDGCDRFCSYCIIPMSRGRVRSKSLTDLKEEIDNLAKSGIKEIVLVGINLSAYGKNEDFNIVDAVKICAENESIMRIRLGSLEPDHITEDIVCELSKIEKFCPQFHISLQSGCDRTLKNMNRHYTADEYRQLCSLLRNSFEDASITTDVMVGFHEETEEDFYNSLNFVKEISFEKVHVFPYSQREGTNASKKGDSVSKKEKEHRAEIMINETEKIRKEYFHSLINKTVCVLFENEIQKGIYQGYTKNYTPVRLSFDTDIIGKEMDVVITDTTDEYCISTLQP